MLGKPQPHPIDYRGPASPAPRGRRMPLWEHLIVSAIFGGIFFGAFGCLCPFEAIQSLSIPILLVLQYFWSDPAPNAQIARLILAQLLTGAVIGFCIAAVVAIVFKDREE
jgi:hypothetical protein